MNGLDMLGADEGGGFDYGSLLQTAGGLIQGGVAIYEGSEAEKKLTGDTKKKLNDVIAVDIAASTAIARAIIAPKEAAAAKAASDAQDKAGADLPPEVSQKRMEAADKMLASMKANAKAKPKDAYAAALVKAWTVTAQKAHSAGLAGGDKKGDKVEESWFSRKIIGPLPGSAVLVLGVGVLAGLGLVLKKILSR